MTEPEVVDVEEQLDSAEAAQEFQAGAPHFFASSANVFGTTRIDGDAVAGSKFVQFFGDSIRTLVSGPLPDSHRALLARFVEPGGYADLLRRLRAERVLVLRGPASSGRRMAALRLLADVVGPRIPLVALDPATPLDRLVEQLSGTNGYVVADLILTAESPLQEIHLFAARQALEQSSSYLVITVDSRAPSELPADALHDWYPPAARDILKAYLTPPDVRGKALQLTETHTFLRGGPPPVEVAGYARGVVAYLDGSLDIEELAAYGADAARQLAHAVFTEARYCLRDKAFAIALAVFDRSSYPLAAAAGDDLYRGFQLEEEPERAAGVSVFGTDRTARLDLLRAVEYGGTMGYRYSSTWLIVLQHVWLEHPAVRKPMVDWLHSLAEDPRTLHGIRAAVAAGCLAAADFDSVRRDLLEPWANSPQLRIRHLAAWALSTAVDQGAEDRVRHLLRYWATGSAAKRWTVVRTLSVLANLLGKSSFGLLATIARQPAQDEPLRRELVSTLADQLTGPLSRQTLGTLVSWSEAGDVLRPLAHQAFLQAASRTSSAPALLAKIAADRLSRRLYTALWRLVLDDKTTRQDALRRLRGLVVLAAGKADFESELTTLFKALPTSRNEHDRLEHLLRTLPTDAPNTAQSLAARIHREFTLPVLEQGDPNARH